MGATILIALAGLATRLPEAPDSSPAPVLQWRAPMECPSRPELEDEVERLLSGSSSSIDLELDARVENIHDGYQLTLIVKTRGGVSRHRLEDTSCDTLMQVTALLAAVAAVPEDAQFPVQTELTARRRGSGVSEATPALIALR